MLRAKRELKIYSFLLIFAGATLCLAGHAPDCHYALPAGLLYQRSTFAHGYIHGYEDGFHMADEDYHLGRAARRMDSLHEYREASAGYHHNFGSKDAFKKGYRDGLTAGYDDSIHNRSFRAISAARRAADGLKAPDGKPDKFDPGFASGYASAYNSMPQSLDCRANSATDFCDGYARGYGFATFSTEVIVAGGAAREAQR